MRVLAGLMTLALVLPGIAKAEPRGAPGTLPKDAGKCARTTSHPADQRSRNGPLLHKKLNQMPPATAYMAVYRQIAGCEAPLTMVEYRSGGRR